MALLGTISPTHASSGDAVYLGNAGCTRLPKTGDRKRPRGEAIATEPEKRRAMTWARRLKRVFKIDTEAVSLHAAVRLRSVRSFPSAANLYALVHFDRIATGRFALLARWAAGIGLFHIGLLSDPRSEYLR